MIKSEFIVSPCKWRNRYVKYGIDGLKDVSKRLHDIKTKVTKEIEEIVLDLRLKTFGTNSRIRFRLKRLGIISLSSRTIIQVIEKTCSQPSQV